MRVKVNGTVISDLNNVTAYNNLTLTSNLLNPSSLTYNLSSYAGMSSVHVTFESACCYNTNVVTIDDVCVFDVNPCTYYSVAAVADSNVTCYGFSDGIIDLTTTNGTPPYSYSWSGPNGFVSNTEDISNLAAGDYNVSITDQNNCTSLATISISAPEAVAAHK